MSKRGEAAKLYIGDGHSQHDPFVPNRVTPFVDYFEDSSREQPKSHVVVSYSAAKTDIVVPHQNSKVDEKGSGRMTVDILRGKTARLSNIQT